MIGKLLDRIRGNHIANGIMVVRHKQDIEHIKGWLADEKSKKIWEQMIEFRKTMNYKLHPGRELPQYFAEKIIKRNKPKLAICIYHSDKDMLEIIQYIYSVETVLYAVV